jgi:hypothetical protein
MGRPGREGETVPLRSRSAGFEYAPLASIKGGDAQANAEILTGILSARRGRAAGRPPERRVRDRRRGKAGDIREGVREATRRSSRERRWNGSRRSCRSWDARPAADPMSGIFRDPRRRAGRARPPKERYSMEDLRKIADIRGPRRTWSRRSPRAGRHRGDQAGLAVARLDPAGLDAVEAARAYLAGGAWAVSVLTEERLFGGR